MVLARRITSGMMESKLRKIMRFCNGLLLMLTMAMNYKVLPWTIRL